MTINLIPEKALIFRITHRDNIPWILDHGFHCRNSGVIDPNFRRIGNPELIERRRSRRVPIPPGGTLGDYVPFYFTPSSPMLLNITTGYGGITRYEHQEIVIFITSLLRLERQGIPFVFTDRHAYLRTARFYSLPSQLDRIDWKLLRACDFQRDEGDPEKLERYQAEALIHESLPVPALLAIACYNQQESKRLRTLVTERHLDLHVVERPRWYRR